MGKEEDNLRLIIADNIRDFGNKVNQNLKLIRNVEYDYIVPASLTRFSNSEGKANILQTVRGKDTFILSDISNYNQKYRMYGRYQRMSYDDHYQDIKRAINATSGTTNRMWVVTPLLYQSRQHKIGKRESLDCAMGLKELEFHGVNGIITFDAHDPSSCASAVNRMSFDNLYPTNAMLNQFVDDEDIDFSKVIVVNPDDGAIKRANHFANILNADTGGFKKVRDLSVIRDGKNPILFHKYQGTVPLEGKNVIVVDDMISSGGSMVDVLKDLKKYNPENIYIFCTFALFTDGKKSANLFKKAYEENLFNKLYTTNLSYIPNEVKEQPWLVQVDCSMQLAQVINAESQNTSISPFLNGNEKVTEKVLKKIKKD